MVGLKEGVEAQFPPAGLVARRRCRGRPSPGKFIEDRLDSGFRTELAMMPIGGDDELAAIALREGDALLVGVGVGIGFGCTASGEGDRCRSQAFQLQAAHELVFAAP
jgi:hypothetical protein